MSELKPCPFCGGEAKISMKYVGYGSLGLGAHDWFGVYCADCDTSTREHQTEAEAIAAWNRRASGWVNCSERLPERAVEVLAVDGKGVCVAVLDRSAEGRWFGVSRVISGRISQWMPNPEPLSTKEEP